MINPQLEQQINTIKESVNIIDIIGSFEILKKKGVNYVCKCPFHDENTASFTVSAAKGIYKCFGCGVAGDAITFLQKHLSIEFMDAVRWLASYYRLPLNEQAPRQQPTPIKAKYKREPTPPAPAQYIPKEIFNKSLTSYSNNNFVKFLHTLFDTHVVNALIDKYYIGTSSHYNNACIFWQVDLSYNIRYGKIMGYNPETGKRIKGEFPQIISVTAAMAGQHKKEGSTPPEWLVKYDLQDTKDCSLFGLHLLGNDLAAPVAIVESEKTAILASVFIPDFIWLATGAKGYKKTIDKAGQVNTIPELFKSKFTPLQGRNVVLFPDNGAFEDWEELARQLSDTISIEVSPLLHEVAAELPDKADLADYLTSPAAKARLIESFKNALLVNPDDSPGAQMIIRETYRGKGLKAKDIAAACKELINENIFVIDDG